MQELEHVKPPTRGRQGEQQRQAECGRERHAAQEPRHVQGGGPVAGPKDHCVWNNATLGEPQAGIKEGERHEADPHTEQRLGHEPGREHAFVAQGLEPRPLGAERNQTGQEQQEESGYEAEDEKALTARPRRSQTERRRVSSHKGNLTLRRGVARCVATSW